MKPLPKWIGWLSLLAGLVVPGGAFAGLLSPEVATIVLTGTTILGQITHSLNGTGGAPK